MALLVLEAEAFIQDAYASYYFAPNRFIPKRERPKWRFIVMRLYKALQRAGGNAQERAEAADLLIRLYKLLCDASEKWLFSSSEPFESLRISQADFFRAILALKQAVLPPEEFTEFAVRHATADALDRYSFHADLIEAALPFFKTPDAKEEALAVCRRARNAVKATLRGQPRAGRLSDQQEGRANALTRMIFALHAALHDDEAAIADFKANGRYGDPESSLYSLLRTLYDFGQMDLLLREYDRAVNEGIHPQEVLGKIVRRIREEDRLPPYFG